MIWILPEVTVTVHLRYLEGMYHQTVTYQKQHICVLLCHALLINFILHM